VNHRLPPPVRLPAAACGGVAGLPPVATIEDPVVIIRKILNPPRAPDRGVSAPAAAVRPVRLELSPSTGARADARGCVRPALSGY